MGKDFVSYKQVWKAIALEEWPETTNTAENSEAPSSAEEWSSQPERSAESIADGAANSTW